MASKWSLLVPLTLLILRVYKCQQEDAIQQALGGGVTVLNGTNEKLKQGLELAIGAPFKPFEVIGTYLESSFVLGTDLFGNFLQWLGQQSRKMASSFQTNEEKFVDCVKTEQYDPVKAIVLDITTCITGTTDKLDSVVVNSLKQLNSTYGILKTLTEVPSCNKDPKCLADYTTGIVGKIGSMGLGLATIVKDVTIGLAAAPATIPVCFSTKPATSPAKVFSKLGLSIAQCFRT